MEWLEAFELLRNGQKIKLKHWENKYLSFNGETFNCYIHYNGKEWIIPSLPHEELLSGEWELYEGEE